MTTEAARFAAILKGWGPTLKRAVQKTKRRIPGDGDGDGIPYESRGKKVRGYDPAAEQAKGEKAIAHVIANKADVHNAMTTPSGRNVTFLWGSEKKSGIAHAVRDAKGHGPEIARLIPIVLSRGVESAPYHPHDKNLSNPTTISRVMITHGTVNVVLSNSTPGKQGGEWVLTAFDEKGGRPGATSHSPESWRKLRKSALTDFAVLGSGTENNIGRSLSLLKGNIHRWPAGASGGRGGEFAPANAGGGGAGARAGRSHPAPPDTSRFSQSHSSVPRINRRMQQMDDMAAAGNIDFIRSMRTSRSNSYERTVDDYRNQLIAHFDPQARLSAMRGTMPTPPEPPAEAAAVLRPQTAPAPSLASGLSPGASVTAAPRDPASLRSSAPAAPALRGSNMANSALVSAQRHINRMSFIAQNSADPLTELQAISIGSGAGRTNTYLRQAQGYHASLVAHFQRGETAADAPRAPAAHRAPVQGQDASQPAGGADPGRAPHGAAARAREAQASAVMQAIGQEANPAIAQNSAVNAMGYRSTAQRLAYRNAFRATAMGEPVREQRTAIRRNAAALGAEHARLWMAQRGQPVPAPAPIASQPAAAGKTVLHTGKGGVQYHPGTGASTPAGETFSREINVVNRTFTDNGRTMSIEMAALSSIAANPAGLTVRELGFIPRPNVPINGARVDREGSTSGGVTTPWPSEAARQLANAYLSQSSTLQTRAREYQIGNFRPSTPEQRAAAAAAAQREQERLARVEREAAVAEERRRASIPENFRVQSTPGNNVERITANGFGSRFTTPTLSTKERATEFAKRLIADYGLGVKFSVSIESEGPNNITMRWRGDDRTSMKREFTQNSDGSVSVYHAFFEAGQRGEGAGKRFFRVAMGEYMAMGVKQVTVTANIDVGGYAWARYGYLPRNQQTWDSLRSTLSSKLERLNREGSVSPQGYKAMKAHLSNTDLRTLWKVSDMKDPNGFELGKKLLLDTSWSGIIRLNDEEQMRRFTAYVSRG